MLPDMQDIALLTVSRSSNACVMHVEHPVLHNMTLQSAWSFAICLPVQMHHALQLALKFWLFWVACSNQHSLRMLAPHGSAFPNAGQQEQVAEIIPDASNAMLQISIGNVKH